MYRKIKRTISNVLMCFDVKITKYSTFERLKRNRDADADIGFLAEFHDKDIEKILRFIKYSKSQLRQDLFVLSELHYKEGGFFVEFGATNGVELSNTFLLEKKFGWSGILAEPGKVWHDELVNNRNCTIVKKCVWSESDLKIQFNEVDNAELSTISQFSENDIHSSGRFKYKKYNVETISLEDMLAQYKAPHVIDYLSIDTEGSEFDILQKFDFNKWKFRIITCEHNYSNTRDKVYELLSKNGYKRVHEAVSRFDDWYVYCGSHNL